MKPRNIITAAAMLAAFTSSAAGGQLRFTAQGMDVEIQFLSPSTVKVHKAPVGAPAAPGSLVVIKTPENCEIIKTEKGDSATLATSSLLLKINKANGSIDFFDTTGRHLLKDKEYGTSFTPILDAGKPSGKVRASFLLEPDEPIYGIGQVMDGRFNRRSSTYHMQNENMFTYSPLVMSPTKNYALYWDNYSISDFADSPQEMAFEGIGNHSDYYFIYGHNADGIVAGIRDLTGHAPMLPLWAYGFFQSKERYNTQYEHLGILKKYRKLGVPIDCVIQDWRYWPEWQHTDSAWNSHSFDPVRYPQPVEWADSIHALGGKLMIVAWPGFGPKTQQRAELDSKGMILGFDTWPPNSGARPYDVFSEEARDIYWKYLDKGIFSYIGNDGWWLDSTEPDHINRQDSDYDTPTARGSYRSTKNTYSLMHNTGIAQHQKAADRSKRVVILTRSGFVGQQRLGSNTWSGDVQSTWETLASHIPAALNFTVMGIPNWNSDIGGFFAWRWHDHGGIKSPEFQELYTRWNQFGAFSPMMRSHGTDLPREIWQFGEKGTPVYDAIERMIRLRYRLLPYIYSTSWDISANDGTFMRPLFFDFPADTAVYNIGSEYLFGRNILVSPVTEPAIKTWNTYLPEGTAWWDFWNNRKLTGGQTDHRPTYPDEIPLYLRAGTILPFGPDVQYSTEKKWDNLEIRVYPGADGTFTLYEDEFDNYNYENGAYTTITFTWNDADRTLTISDRKGTFPGMLKTRKFRIVLIETSATPGDIPLKPTRTITYSGRQRTITL